MKLSEIMAQSRLARVAKSAARSVIGADAAEVIVKELPMGFFTLRREGTADVLAHNSVFGLLVGVKDHFWCGHKYFQRERDQRVPLVIWKQPAPQLQQAYGN